MKPAANQAWVKIMLRKVLFLSIFTLSVLVGMVYWSYSGAIFRAATDAKVIALTFDDGPNPPHTQALLALLDEQDVKATFFLKGRHVEAFPDIARMVARRGHEVANHGYFHKPMIALASQPMYEEIVRTGEIIKEHLELDRSPRLFRPPYGLQGPGLKRALEHLGMASILMSDHGKDWEVSNPAMIAETVLDSVQSGSIILLHDGHGDVDDPYAQESRGATVQATRMIIQSLKSQGYRFVTVGEILEIEALGG